MENKLNDKTFTGFWEFTINDYKESQGGIPPELESHMCFMYCLGALAHTELLKKIARTHCDDEKIRGRLLLELDNEIKALAKV